MKKSILILSGGLDSTVSSWIVREKTQPLLALTFDYGQRASLREQEASRKVAQQLSVPHRILSLPWLSELTSTALVNHEKEVPCLREEDLNDQATTLKSASSVWVPNRNGLFLNIAAAFAESLEADLVVTGFNAEEGNTFPDNSAPFVEIGNQFFSYATQRHIRVESYTLHWNKTEIVKKAMALNIELKDLWFCYEGGEVPCRRCESCLRAFRAFREAGAKDPWGDL